MRLIARLEEIGTMGELLGWIRECLKGRKTKSGNKWKSIAVDRSR